MYRVNPDSAVELPRRRYFSLLELHAAAIGAIALTVLLVGYGLGIEHVQSIVPGFPTMKARTATLLLLLSLSYLLSLRNMQWARWTSSGLALTALLFAAWMALNRTSNIVGEPWSYVPSNATIFGLFAGGVAMLIVNHASRWAAFAALLALLAATPALFRILALVMFQGAPDDNSPLNTMALHTAALITWFMLVCVILHPRLGIGRRLLQASLQGRLLRTMLPIAVLLPAGAGAVTYFLSVQIKSSSESLFALDAALYVILGAIILWRLSSVVDGWQREANAKAARLSRANESLEQYASSTAHDLKAPARHILLYGQLLEGALAKGDLETARRHAGSLRASATELPRMIDEMLAYSRAAHTRVSLGDAMLSELVQAGAAPLTADLLAAGASVKVLVDVRLRCDSSLITTVFQNLIGNAVRYRSPERALQVRVNAEHGDGGWRISVEDNGIGFDPDFAVVAFNPLARGVHAASGATGIGLAACRNIVQGHGGEIHVDPTYRDGARIVFTLPDGPPAPPG